MAKLKSSIKVIQGTNPSEADTRLVSSPRRAMPTRKISRTEVGLLRTTGGRCVEETISDAPVRQGQRGKVEVID